MIKLNNHNDENKNNSQDMWQKKLSLPSDCASKRSTDLWHVLPPRV